METIAESLFGTMEKVSFRRDNLTLAGHLFKPADFDDTKVVSNVDRRRRGHDGERAGR
jgi:hypothetical protein